MFSDPNQKSLGVDAAMGMEGLALHHIVGWVVGGAVAVDGPFPKIIVWVSQALESASLEREKRLEPQFLPAGSIEQEYIQTLVRQSIPGVKGIEGSGRRDGREIFGANHAHRMAAAAVCVKLDHQVVNLTGLEGEIAESEAIPTATLGRDPGEPQ